MIRGALSPARADGSGCVVGFDDPQLSDDRNESVYYARAIQAPSLAVNGDPLRCERDALGSCIRARPCGMLADGTPDDCLAPIEERAWSSPIFVDFDRAAKNKLATDEHG